MVQTPLNQKLFLKRLIETKSICFFFKKGTFNKAFDPQTLYLSRIGPVLACIIMGIIVIHLQMAQKFINLKQKILRL